MMTHVQQTDAFQGLIYISTDALAPHLPFLGLGPLAPQVRTTIRDFMAAQHFSLMDLTNRDWADPVIEELEQRLDRYPGARDQVFEYLVRASGFEDRDLSKALNYWHYAFGAADQAPALMPLARDREKREALVAAFRQLVRDPRAMGRDTFAPILKSWPRYPEEVGADRARLMQEKTTWDREVYEHCILYYELMIDNHLSQRSLRMSHLVDWYVDHFDATERQRFYEDFVSCYGATEPYPSAADARPLEDLRKAPPWRLR